MARFEESIDVRTFIEPGRTPTGAWRGAIGGDRVTGT
jgi:hypothetical protein